MATSLTLLKTSLFLSMPSSSVSSLGEILDHFGRTTTAPFVSLPPWRRCPGSSRRWWSYSLLEENPLLHLPSLSFLYFVQVALVVGWRMLCRPSLRWRILCRWATLADALPLSSLVGVLFGRMLCRRCWLVGWMLCHLVCVTDFRTCGGVVLFAGSVV